MLRDITNSTASSGFAPARRRARGSISRMASGSLRVRVYAGLDPITGRRRYLRQTVPPGPTALEDAEAACRRLLTLVHDRRYPRTDVTLAELLDRH
jgi:integrase